MGNHRQKPPAPAAPQPPPSPTSKTTAKYTNKDGSKFITIPKAGSSTSGSAQPSPSLEQSNVKSVLQSEQVGPDLPAPTVNRKKQKRREKAAAKAAAEQSQNNQTPDLGPPSPADSAVPSLDRRSLDVEHDSSDDHRSGQGMGTVPSAKAKKSRRKKKRTAGAGVDDGHSNDDDYHGEQQGHNYPPRSAHRDPGAANRKIWNSSSLEERKKIKEFWLGLGEEERKGLVKVEKDAVLKKMKEQQKQTCSCTVCGRKRTAIEEELEGLYDAYYAELEQFTHIGNSNGEGPPMLGSPKRLGPAGSRVGSSRLSPSNYPPQPSRGRIMDDVSDEEAGEDYASNADYASDADDGYDQNEPREEDGGDPLLNEFFDFGRSLTVQGGILTVADDLLKNDGKKFIEMMEQLAERRMQREEHAKNTYSPHPAHSYVQSNGDADGQSDGAPEDEEYEDEEYEDEDDEDDEYESDEEEQGTMTEEQRMKEGRRMFQIFAARMFEQRVLSAYKEKVALDNQNKLLQEIERDTLTEAQRKEKKAKDAQKRKEKAAKKKAALAEEKKRKEDEEKRKEEARKLEEDRKAEEQRKKAEEKRRKKEEQKKAEEQERLRKEQERLRQKEKQAEAERKAREAREAKEREKEAARQREREAKERKEKEKEAARQREREAKERKEQEARDRREQEARELEAKGRREQEARQRKEQQERERERKEREAKNKAEREAWERATAVARPPTRPAEPPVAHKPPAAPAPAPYTQKMLVKRPAQAAVATPVPALPQQPSTAVASPQIPAATPVVPKAPPSMMRNRQPSQQESTSGSSQSTSHSESNPSQAPSPHPLTPSRVSPGALGPAAPWTSSQQPFDLTANPSFAMERPQAREAMAPSYHQSFQTPFSGSPMPHAAAFNLSRQPPAQTYGHPAPPPGLSPGPAPPYSGMNQYSSFQAGQLRDASAASQMQHRRQSSTGHGHMSPSTTSSQMTTKPQPIRPPSVVPSQQHPGGSLPAGGWGANSGPNQRLGSSALLPDSEEATEDFPTADRRNTYNHPGNPETSGGFGGNLWTQQGQSRQAGVFGSGPPASGSNRPPWPPTFGMAGVPSAVLSELQSGASAILNGPQGGPQSGLQNGLNRPNRSVTVRSLLCQACKTLASPQDTVVEGMIVRAGYVSARELKEWVDRQLGDPTTDDELNSLWDTLANPTNGGGSFDVSEEVQGEIYVRWMQDGGGFDHQKPQRTPIGARAQNGSPAVSGSHPVTSPPGGN